MAYQKKIMVLKGNPSETIVFEGDQEISYTLSGSKWDPNTSIYLFYHEGKWEILDSPTGKKPLDLDKIVAVAVAEGEDFKVKGDWRSFDWNEAYVNVSMENYKISSVQKPLKIETEDETTPYVAEPAEEISDGQAKDAPIEESYNVGYEPVATQAETMDKEEKLQPPWNLNPVYSVQPQYNFLDGLNEAKQEPEESVEEELQTMEKEESADSDLLQQGGKESECPFDQETYLSPFPDQFEESVWRKMYVSSEKGEGHYLLGEIYEKGKIVATAVAIPGEYSATPPGWLKGFHTYLYAKAGAKGYWLKITRIE